MTPEHRAGLAAGIGAYAVWGTLPILIKALAHVAPADVLAFRVLASILLCAVLILALGRLKVQARVLQDRRTLGLLAVSASLIGVNWLIYIIAIATNHVLQASLGYYINPLFNVLLGVLFLGERLPRAGWAAFALAALGVVILTVETGAVPWLSLGLATTFALYGLVRRHAPVDALSGFTVETLMLLPAALLWLLFWGKTGVEESWTTYALLAAAGPMTAVPLILFGHAARRIPFSTLGLLQYIAPSMIFLLGAFVYDEPLGWPQLAAFAAIWTGLALYAADGFLRARRRALAQTGSLR